jgi:electron transfer flavoprotein beta subunit
MLLNSWQKRWMSEGEMMNIIVPIKLVPDLVEELSIDENGNALDMSWVSLILNEFDDHAIEQAILLKENGRYQVTIIAPDVEGADDVLFTAAAKGADRLIKLAGDFEGPVNNHALARLLKPVIADLNPDLVLTGVQAHNDLDGSLGPLLAEAMGFPYVGYVAGVEGSNGRITVFKEYPGGVTAEMTVSIPAVLGIQAASSPLRYVAFSRVRQAMKTAVINEQPTADLDPAGGPVIRRMFVPETRERATMIEGEVEEIAAGLFEIMHGQGVL